MQQIFNGYYVMYKNQINITYTIIKQDIVCQYIHVTPVQIIYLYTCTYYYRPMFTLNGQFLAV